MESVLCLDIRCDGIKSRNYVVATVTADVRLQRPLPSKILHGMLALPAVGLNIALISYRVNRPIRSVDTSESSEKRIYVSEPTTTKVYLAALHCL